MQIEFLWRCIWDKSENKVFLSETDFGKKMTIFLSFFKLLHFKLVNDCEKKRVMHNKKLLLTQLATLDTRDGLIKGLK